MSPPEEDKQNKSDEKKDYKRGIKVVEYSLESNASDEAGGNLDDYSPEKAEITQNEDFKDTCEGSTPDLFNKVRTTSTSKNMKENDLQADPIEKNKKRRNRIERESRDSPRQELENMTDNQEESKENHSVSFGDSNSNIFDAFGAEHANSKPDESEEKGVESHVDKQRASISEVEEVKQPTEDSKQEISNSEINQDYVEVVNEESKQEGCLIEQADRQPSSNMQQVKREGPEVKDIGIQSLQEKRLSESSKSPENFECTYCKTRNPSRQNKFEKSVEDLVVKTIREQLPSLLSETVKQNVASTIVKQTKSEMSGIHNSNFERIEKTVMTFAENKLNESEKAIEAKAKDKINSVISDKFKEIFKSTVLPHCEKMIEETMTELIDTVKQCLEENESKVKEIEERVDDFIKNSKIKESTSAPPFRNYASKESNSFTDIFKTNYKESQHEPNIEQKMGKPYGHEKSFPEMMPTNIGQYKQSHDNPFKNSMMGQEYMEPMKPKETQWAGYPMGEYSQQPKISSPGFADQIPSQYSDPEYENKRKMVQGLQYFLENNVDCLFGNENIYMQMYSK